ncbi:MAG: hypothetical protein GY720_21425 [bacterium]|nr:hypothetical protein [bacterium]
MAEGIARARYGDRATFSGAGTIAVRGSVPTTPATTASDEIGVDIRDLRATQLNKSFSPLPDHIYVMTNRHRERVISAFPGFADRVELLDPNGDVPDPYGYDIDVYRAARDQIAAAIDARAKEWTDAAPPPSDAALGG